MKKKNLNKPKKNTTKKKYNKVKYPLGGSPSDPVYIAIREATQWKVNDARDYQQYALNEYIDNNTQGLKIFTINQNSIIFAIDKQPQTEDLYTYYSIDRTGNTIACSISRNKEGLLRSISLANRVADF